VSVSVVKKKIKNNTTTRQGGIELSSQAMPPVPTWPVGTLRFRVDGPPVPLQRPRFANGRVYNPSAADMRAFLSASRAHAPPTLADGGPVEVTLEFVFARPASHTTSRGALRASAPPLHTNKPDVDNLIKLVLDALNGTFYADDRQVVAVQASKRFAAPGELAGTVVEMRYGVPRARAVRLRALESE